jgi:hypothetical protein
MTNPGAMSQVCNPSYLGDGDQEDSGSKSAWANGFWDPISTNDWEAQTGGLRSKPAKA